MATVHMLTTADDTLAGYSGADFRRLSAAAACDKFGKHQLIESPEQADIILFVGSTYPDHRDVRSHPFLRSYREKCFMFHSDDYVIPFLPGVYVNIARRWHSDRTATGSYLQLTQWDHVPYIPSMGDCKYLFCFVGSTRTHAVRRRLMKLKHPRGYLEDTSELISASERNKAFVMVDYQKDTKTHYGEIISRSKFVLCPRGYACSTWRLFETMKAGRIPIIISDEWVPPKGPSWETFSIRVKENKISRIPALLEQHEPQSEAMGRRARVVFEEWFSKETVFHRIVEWCLTLQCSSRRSKIRHLVPYIQLLRPFYIRHVLLPETTRFIRDRTDGINRFRQKSSSKFRNP